MAKDPSFQWYASDWLGSNRRAMMTLEQQGAYMALLCRQWADKTCSLPDDDEVLARLSELGEGWLLNGSEVLRVCFPPHPTLGGRLANEKLLRLRGERDEWIAKSREGGKKSGKTRRAKARQKKTYGKRTKREPPHEPNANQTRTKREPNANTPSPSPSPSLREKTPLNPPRGKVVFDPLKVDLPFDSPEFVAAWRDWTTHRTEIKKKLTLTQVAKQLDSLKKLGETRAIDSIEYTIEKGWQGLREPDDGPNPKAESFMTRKVLK